MRSRDVTWLAYCQRLRASRWHRRYLTARRDGETKAQLRERAQALAPAGWQLIVVPASLAPVWLAELAALDQRGYTLEETTARLGVKPVTIRSYVMRGYLHPLPALRGASRYNRAEVDALAASPPRPGRPVTTGAGLRRKDRRHAAGDNATRRQP